ncbi:hypothetical protein HYW21_07690 [Candidatus Woesearchaeota archaeon]|nr:hypothetical protein [Candidatus Woesearchaeota archaeon]
MKSTCYFTTLVIYLLLLTILNINRVTAVPLVEPDVEEALNQTDRIKVNIVFVKNITPEDFVASLNLSSEHFKIIYITYSRTAAQAIVSRVGFEELKKRDDLLGIGMPKLFELTNEAILKELNKSGSVLVEILLNENISQNEVIVDLQSMDNGFNMIQKRYSPRSIVANIYGNLAFH